MSLLEPPAVRISPLNSFESEECVGNDQPMLFPPLPDSVSLGTSGFLFPSLETESRAIGLFSDALKSSNTSRNATDIFGTAFLPSPPLEMVSDFISILDPRQAARDFPFESDPILFPRQSRD